MDIMQKTAEAFVDHLEKVGAENYLECTFTNNVDSSKSIIVTVSYIEGKSPHQKLMEAQERIQELEEKIKAGS